MKVIKKEQPTATLTYTPFENIDKLLNNKKDKEDKKEDK